ncbi:ABC transporter permease [Variovorax guangxiensis]|uniref:Peptide/nickel transport system permease protein n=1 Tax=Variovorax guangxiensis TaxID=1775474 RepID=A0A840FVS0_9BURK|nr:ABC transporter permease [Variovorax guangxiensis]MBB4224872.1 peptide/nickel transport system permease protein [Variovorax guangxiensis]
MSAVPADPVEREGAGGPAVEAPASKPAVQAAAAVSASAPATLSRSRSAWRDLLVQLFESRLATAASVLLVVVVLAVTLAPWIAPQNPYDLGSLDILDSKLPPGSLSGDGTMRYWLGSDEQGRDLLSTILYGLRISLYVGVLATSGALLIGTLMGLIAAYARGWVDSLIMRIVDIQLALPGVLIALMLLSILGKGIDKVVIALVVGGWAFLARAARASAMVERDKEYMEAALGLGFSPARRLLRHLLPNCMPPLMVLATIGFAEAIAAEAALSFLGVGVPASEPSLGMLTANGFDYLMSGKYWLSLFPGLALALTILAFNIVGDRLRQIVNPRGVR